MVSLGRADAGLTWRGLAAQWKALGLNLKYLVGMNFSNHPSNGYAIRTADLKDKKRVDAYTRFFKASCMAYDFTRTNPFAAAQITYAQFPDLREQMNPQLALDAMLELGTAYFEGDRVGKGYGYSDPAAWKSYIETVHGLGQIENHLKVENVISNAFVEGANDYDREKVREQAKAHPLTDEFKDLKVNYAL
jgi:NitT/TauT family transport system substrate-binding protein